MALRVAKFTTLFSESHISTVSSLGFTKTNTRTLFFTSSISSNFISPHPGESVVIPLAKAPAKLDEDAKTANQEFQKWCSGGGMFHKSAFIDPTARIEMGALVHSESIIGANVSIGSGSIVGPDVTIGQSTITGYNVVLSNCTVGESCIIHHGVSVGQDGFGFFIDEQGCMVKKPQRLKARIGNHVEIGANTCIDRGSWRDTIIGDHTKIDNLVQIAHNVEIGKNCMLCGQVGIAGSVTLGDYVTLGGRVSICDHVCVASKVRLAANSCVTKNIREAGDYGGFPAMPVHDWRKQVVSARQISKEFWLQRKMTSASETSPTKN